MEYLFIENGKICIFESGAIPSNSPIVLWGTAPTVRLFGGHWGGRRDIVSE